MKEIVLRFPDAVPDDQIDQAFLQGMLDRMAFGYYNYGPVRRSLHQWDGLANVAIRLERYKSTGNTEFLMDAANYCMMEFMVPSVAGAHFTPTDKAGSPGAIVDGRLVYGKEDYSTVKQRQRREGD